MTTTADVLAAQLNFTELRNHTPHEIRLLAADGSEIVLPPVAPCVRLRYDMRQIATAAGIPVVRAFASKVVDLPPEEAGVGRIVSRMVADRMVNHRTSRLDILCPEDHVRDSAGRVVGCRALLTMAI